MQFLIQPTPTGPIAHIITTPQDPDPPATACGVPIDPESPELAAHYYRELANLTTPLCTNCRKQYDADRARLNAWNARATRTNQ